jgi:hypothetical protein
MKLPRPPPRQPLCGTISDIDRCLTSQSTSFAFRNSTRSHHRHPSSRHPGNHGIPCTQLMRALTTPMRRPVTKYVVRDPRNRFPPSSSFALRAPGPAACAAEQCPTSHPAAASGQEVTAVTRHMSSLRMRCGNPRGSGGRDHLMPTMSWLRPPRKASEVRNRGRIGADLSGAPWPMPFPRSWRSIHTPIAFGRRHSTRAGRPNELLGRGVEIS